jgi:hypothetical protein
LRVGARFLTHDDVDILDLFLQHLNFLTVLQPVELGLDLLDLVLYLVGGFLLVLVMTDLRVGDGATEYDRVEI